MAGRPRARRRLLVLGAGPAQLGLLEAARARDEVEVVAVDRDPQAVGFPLADERAILSSEDEEAIDRLARARDVDGIVSPGADWPVGIAARVAERIGIPHPIDSRTATLATSKSRQHDAFVAAGVPHARALDPADAGLAFPCVVKAPDRQGQRGLTFVERREDLDDALSLAAGESRAGGVLVEEHVDGPEVTVNGFSLDGTFTALIVTDRLTAEPPAFGVALAHVWPSEHDTAGAVEVGRAAVEAVGIRNGPSYTQVRLGPDGPVVMEVAARLGGGHDAELCRAATGVDLNGLAIDAALGSVPPESVPHRGLTPVTPGLGDASRGTDPFGVSPRGPTPVKPELGDASRGTDPFGVSPRGLTPACVVFLVPPPGRLLAVDGVAEAEAVEGVAWVRVYRRPGHVFGPFRRGADRAGAVLATGASRDEALSRGRRAADAVRFRVDADAP